MSLGEGWLDKIAQRNRERSEESDAYLTACGRVEGLVRRRATQYTADFDAFLHSDDERVARDVLSREKPRGKYVSDFTHYSGPTASDYPWDRFHGCVVPVAQGHAVYVFSWRGIEKVSLNSDIVRIQYASRSFVMFRPSAEEVMNAALPFALRRVKEVLSKYCDGERGTVSERFDYRVKELERRQPWEHEINLLLRVTSAIDQLVRK